MSHIVFKAGHLFCGLGGGARGFKRGRARIGRMRASFRNVGGIDIDPAAIADFERLAGCRGTVMDLASREQYIRFNGRQPPEGWREATPADIRRAMNNEAPNVWFTSSPCKGLSGLLSEEKSKTDKYQALNELTLRGIWLALEAFADDPAEFILFENVPRIQNRGRHLLDQIMQLLHAYGYAAAETTHDCGELGALAQSRKRFLLVARHMAKVPQFLYQPARNPLRAVGQVLGKLPLPGEGVGLGMHRLPQLQWRTWVRLAFVQAGSDWRSLNRLAVEDGFLRDYAIAPAYHRAYGVNAWNEHAGTVTGNGRPASGAFNVADPRFDPKRYECNQYGVIPWNEHSGSLINVKSPGQGTFAIADPRYDGKRGKRFNNVYRVVRFDQHAQTVTAGNSPTSGGLSVADPRPGWTQRRGNNLVVTDWNEHSGVVIAGGKGVQGGWLSVADPRCGERNWRRGPYGVIPWDKTAAAVAGAADVHNGFNTVADPRLPALDERLSCLIVAEDDTWHRPFTTLELAALQSLFDLEEYEDFQLHGTSDSDHRERIGNAVPSAAAEAIANVMAHTLLLVRSGNTDLIESSPIWVRPIVAAIQCGTSI
ncbi:MAG TPA: DNA cytosine methyltransferase [Nevskiaceae bacterium]|nr:DNA cytosine methyltransferase [Nevskiaceae bacterium]